MRDPERIEPFLNKIEEIWKRFPDLRFGQLIGNVIKDPALYYIEDDEFIEILKEYYSRF